LKKKVNAIKINNEKIGAKVDFETNLLIMEDYNYDDTFDKMEELNQAEAQFTID
jgi:hypothetical protein